MKFEGIRLFLIDIKYLQRLVNDDLKAMKKLAPEIPPEFTEAIKQAEIDIQHAESVLKKLKGEY